MDKDKILEVASHELIRAFAGMANAVRVSDPGLADAADVACLGVLCVRDAVKRAGKPDVRWARIMDVAHNHVARGS